MEKEYKKFNSVNFESFDEYQLETAIRILQDRLKKRNEPKIKKIQLIHFDDGCEGSYCTFEQWADVSHKQLYDIINETILEFGNLSINKIEMTEEDYEDYGKHYNWFE